MPASTFKIFNSLVALETAVAPDDQLVIKWDSVARRPEWNKDMNMREAFKVSNAIIVSEPGGSNRIYKGNLTLIR